MTESTKQSPQKIKMYFRLQNNAGFLFCFVFNTSDRSIS